MSDTSETPSEAGHWLTLHDAARFFKVTVRTIDRRGLPKRHEPGHPVEVWCEGATADDVSDPSDSVPDDHTRALALSEHVSDIVRQNTAPLLAALERSEDRARNLERENGILSERLVASQTASDADRQRLSQERDAERRRADALQAQLDEAALAERERKAQRSAWKFWTWGR
jgi:hypothetical protein